MLRAAKFVRSSVNKKYVYMEEYAAKAVVSSSDTLALCPRIKINTRFFYSAFNEEGMAGESAP